MHVRPFGGWEDLEAMRSVASAMLLAQPGRAVLHPGDVSWWVGWPPKTPERLAETFLLWEDGGRVVGFAGYVPDDREFALAVSPEVRDVDAFEDAVEAWLPGDGPLRWLEFEDDPAVDRWVARGFAPTDDHYLNLVRRLDDVATAIDHRVRPVAEGDLDDRALVTHAAFARGAPFERYAADYRAFAASPAYPRGWDLLLRDADGAPAAACIAWTDPVSAAATFEPVATHPSKQRRGFGGGLLTDAFRRLAEAGMRYAIVGVDGDNPNAQALYRSVGFEPDRILRVYERPSSRAARSDR